MSPLLSLEDQASLTVHDIQMKRARKAEVGPSTKDGRRLKKNIIRTKKALEKLLDQRAMWLTVGVEEVNEADHHLGADAIKAMLRSGEMPWVSSGAGMELYLGKLAYRCISDLRRCFEAVSDLRVQKNRLSLWLDRTSTAIGMRLGKVEEGSGHYILLSRWNILIDYLIEQWSAMPKF